MKKSRSYLKENMIILLIVLSLSSCANTNSNTLNDDKEIYMTMNTESAQKDTSYPIASNEITTSNPITNTATPTPPSMSIEEQTFITLKNYIIKNGLNKNNKYSLSLSPVGAQEIVATYDNSSDVVLIEKIKNYNNLTWSTIMYLKPNSSEFEYSAIYAAYDVGFYSIYKGKMLKKNINKYLDTAYFYDYEYSDGILFEDVKREEKTMGEMCANDLKILYAEMVAMYTEGNFPILIYNLGFEAMQTDEIVQMLEE